MPARRGQSRRCCWQRRARYDLACRLTSPRALLRSTYVIGPVWPHGNPAVRASAGTQARKVSTATPPPDKAASAQQPSCGRTGRARLGARRRLRLALDCGAPGCGPPHSCHGHGGHGSRSGQRRSESRRRRAQAHKMQRHRPALQEPALAALTPTATAVVKKLPRDRGPLARGSGLCCRPDRRYAAFAQRGVSRIWGQDLNSSVPN